MGLLQRLFGTSPPAPAPRAATQSQGGGTVITSSAQLEEVMRGGVVSSSGASVTPETAMTVAAVYGCVRLRAGAVATLPLHLKRKIDARNREDISDSPLGQVLSRRPNRWQTPSQFRRMLSAHQLLRGNGYAMKVMRGKEVTELIPLHPDRITVGQNNDSTLFYDYDRKSGGLSRLQQEDVFHLVGLTFDGIRGVSPLTYARNTIGMALASEQAGASLFKNGARTSLVLKHPGKIGQEGAAFLRASVEEYRAGGESEGKALILEEGMDLAPPAMTAEDAQWIESRKFSRTDIAMFFGVPPHMIGDTEKSTSWGTGLEQQTQGFVTFSLEDDLTMWEEAIDRDLVPPADVAVYSRFNRAALVKGDIKTRWEAYVKGLQWGVWSPNEVRALEDMNPREGGDVFYPPPNTAGDTQQGSNSDDPPQDP